MKRVSSLLFITALTGGLASAQSATDTKTGIPSQYWQASIAAETNKDYDAALDQIATYETSGGNAFLAHLRAAWLCYLKQDYKSATAHYLRAEQLQPAAINPLLGLLSVSEAEGDGAAIDQAVQNVLRLDPMNYRAQMAAAYRHYLAKDYALALASYRRVLASYPDDMTALSGEAWSLYYLGQPDKAASDFKTLLGINSSDSWSRKGLALCQQQKTY